jgi:MinD superfamily P-loop ATPase
MEMMKRKNRKSWKECQKNCEGTVSIPVPSGFFDYDPLSCSGCASVFSAEQLTKLFGKESVESVIAGIKARGHFV